MREGPPLRLNIDIETPTGQHHRWADDEPNAESVPSGLSFSSSATGGFDSMDATLARKPNVDYSDLESLSTITVNGASGEIAWEGRLEKTPRVSGDQMSVAPGAVGWQAHLEDNKAAQDIYIDRDLSGFTDPSATQRIAILTLGAAISGEWGVAGNNAGTVDPGLYTRFSRFTAAAASWVEAWYYSGGPSIGQVEYDYTREVGAGGTAYTTQIILASDDSLTDLDEGTDHDGATATGQSLSATEDGRKYLVVRETVAASFDTDVNVNSLWGPIRIYGNHGLTQRGSAPDEGFYASDVIADVVGKWAPRLNFTTGDNGSISPTSFVIPQLAFKEPTTAAEMIRQANRFHLRDWAVWDNKTFYYSERGSIGRNWRARVAPAQLEEAGPDVARLFNGVIVRYRDVDGSTRTVGPTGSNANTEDTDLEDSDPLSAANQLNIRRWEVLDMSGISTAAGATEVGRRFLIESQEFNTSGRAQLVGNVLDDRGVIRPAWQVRGGDTISFVDSADPWPRRIVTASYNHSARTCSVDLDAPAEGLAALLERLQVALVPLGLN